MQYFMENFYYQVGKRPNAQAISTREQSISYRYLADEVKRLSQLLKNKKAKCIAVAVPNCAAWIAFDLAALSSNIVTVPVPHFFTPAQIQHLLRHAGADLVIANDELINTFDSIENDKAESIDVFGQRFFIHPVEVSKDIVVLPKDTLKISYTSGTTGNPKGVIISRKQVDKVIDSLAKCLNADHNDRHLNALPFSLLLENIAGIYTVLANGGQCLIPDPAELGLSGSSSLDSEKFVNTIKAYQPTTLITVPAFAQALVKTSKELGITHDSLRFIAVGGAPLSDYVINEAHEIGLPLYQGYGLTECGSVTALNTPEQCKPGSVGKPLPHVEIEISEQGEILIEGALSHGYLDQSDSNNEKWASGDLGHIDDDGFLYITGRKRTAYSTAFGRNVSPEWVERELTVFPEIMQAIIYGEGKSFNVAIVVPSQNTSDSDIDKAIALVNQELPDYAHISTWFKAEEPYSIKNKQLSNSGIIQRQQVLNDYRNELEHIYQ